MQAQRPPLYLLAPRSAEAQLRTWCAKLSPPLARIPQGEGARGDLLWLSYEVPAKTGAEEAERLYLLSSLLPHLRHQPLALYLPHPKALPVERWAFDLDGTLIPEELLPLLAQAYDQGEAMSQLTEEAMQGQAPFASSFTARTQLLTGLPLSALTQLADSLQLPAGTERLLCALHRTDTPIALVSANYRPLVERLGQRLGFTHTLGSSLRTDSTGRLLGLDPAGLIDEGRKRDFLALWGDPHATVFLGDGANDLPALASVGHAFLVGEGFVRADLLEALPDFLQHLPTNPLRR